MSAELSNNIASLEDRKRKLSGFSRDRESSISYANKLQIPENLHANDQRRVSAGEQQQEVNEESPTNNQHMNQKQNKFGVFENLATPTEMSNGSPKETSTGCKEESRKQQDHREELSRDERRMEINRQRAKEIRKRKKKMLEDMQQQIIFLTLENNKLRTQAQMQLAEINLLRTLSMTGGSTPPGGEVSDMSNMVTDTLLRQHQTTSSSSSNRSLLNHNGTHIPALAEQERNINRLLNLQQQLSSRQLENSTSSSLLSQLVTHQQEPPLPNLLGGSSRMNLLGDSQRRMIASSRGEGDDNAATGTTTSLKIGGLTSQVNDTNQGDILGAADRQQNSSNTLIRNTTLSGSNDGVPLNASLLQQRFLSSQQASEREQERLLFLLLEQQRKRNSNHDQESQPE